MEVVEKARGEKPKKKEKNKEETEDQYNRRMAGYMVIGFIVLFTSVGGYLWADKVYFTSFVYATNVHEFDPLELRSGTIFILNYTFQQGKSYDIHVIVDAWGPTKEISGKFTLEISSLHLSKINGTISSTYFNETLRKDDNTKYVELLELNIINPIVHIEITEIQNLKKLSCYIKIFENPNRVKTYTIYTLSGLMTLTGCIFFYGAVIKMIRQDYLKT